MAWQMLPGTNLTAFQPILKHALVAAHAAKVQKPGQVKCPCYRLTFWCLLFEQNLKFVFNNGRWHSFFQSHRPRFPACSQGWNLSRVFEGRQAGLQIGTALSFLTVRGDGPQYWSNMQQIRTNATDLGRLATLAIAVQYEDGCEGSQVVSR